MSGAVDFVRASIVRPAVCACLALVYEPFATIGAPRLSMSEEMSVAVASKLNALSAPRPEAASRSTRNVGTRSARQYTSRPYKRPVPVFFAAAFFVFFLSDDSVSLPPEAAFMLPA